MSWKNLEFEIKNLSLDLDEGASARAVCPKCGNREKTLSITVKDGTVLFQCFRMRCGLSGALHKTSGGLAPANFKKVIKEIPPLELTNLPEEYYYALPVKTLSVAPKWDTKHQLVCYPVLSFYGQRLGYVSRHYKELNSWWSGPKAKNVVEITSTPWGHFPANQSITNTLYIVEDIPSSEAMAPYVPVCALAGTNITDGLLSFFVDIGIKHLRICLDNDAIAKAIKLKRQLSLTFDTIEVIFVDRDPKDMNHEELQSL